MDYTPVEPTALDTDEAMFEAPPGVSWTRFPTRRRPHKTVGETLRYRGLTFDMISGVVTLDDRQMRLAEPECDLLRALMRRAGQIISASHLAEQLGVTVTEVENRARALYLILTEAGAPCLPRRVEGLGYILWR
jgi:DNA-binding response OmpR family regulator